ncbi:MAG: protein kinase, partial [Planctomycetes bacterium]|nr:protein kinase [Planctomycetota bacterium]
MLGRLQAHAPKQSRYRLLGEIARGGMGAIIKIWDEDLRRTLAMKVVLGAQGEQGSGDTPAVPAKVLDRFLEEAQVTAQLDHPGIVPVHELGVDAQGQAFFTMRLVQGRDLEEVFDLVRRGAEDWTQGRATGVILKACEALAYAHNKNVIHRDLKPANIMVGRFGEVYVMDWGLARVLGAEDRADARPRPEPRAPQSIVLTERHAESSAGSPQLTMDGDVVGTPAYMPPEQARGDLAAMGPHSDVYSLGAILYHLLAGHMPFGHADHSGDAMAIWSKLQQGPPPKLETIARGAPQELVAICDKAMAREPGDRYPNMGAMAEDLQAYVEGRVVKAHRTGALVELRKWVSRNRAAAAATAAAAMALVAGFITSLVFFGEARANEVLAKAGEEQVKDTLARSLYEQGQAVRLAGGMGQVDRSLQLLSESARLVQRPRVDPHPGTTVVADESRTSAAELPTLPEIRTAALESLLLAESHQLGLTRLPRSVDGGYDRYGFLGAGSRFLMEMDISSRDNPGAPDRPLQLRMIDLDRMEETRSLTQSHFAGERPLALGPHGDRMVFSGDEGLRLWDLATERPVLSLPVPTQYVERFGQRWQPDRGTLSDSGRYYACQAQNGVALWDLQNAAAPVWVQAPGGFNGGWGDSYGVCFNRAETLVSLSGGSRVTIVDIAGAVVLADREFAQGLRSIARFAADDRVMVQLDRGTWDQVQLWDSHRDVIAVEFTTEGRSSHCQPAVSPDGNLAAFVSYRLGVVVHRLADGAEVLRCERMSEGTVG